jgi:AAA domain
VNPDVRGYCAELGIELLARGRNATMRCPTPDHDDRHPSASISLESGAWNCFACRAAGSAWGLGQLSGRSPAEIAQLLSRYGLREPAEPKEVSPNAARRRPYDSGSAPPPSPEEVDHWHRCLADRPALVMQVDKRLGWSAGTLERLSIGWNGERLTIPVLEPDGTAASVLRYKPDDARKMLAPKGQERLLYPPPEMVDAGDRLLLLVEGESDAITASELGLPAIARPSATIWKPGWSERFAGRRVCVVADCDRPGREGARRVAEDLAPHTSEVRLLDLEPGRDDGYDVGDLWREARADGADQATVRNLLLRAAEGAQLVRGPEAAGPDEPFALSLEEFIAAKSDMPTVLVGDATEAIIPVAGLLIQYAKGGRGKTTETVDAVFHFASGIDWLGFPVARPLRVLLIENEGPRELFREKLAVKRERWPHQINGAIFVYTENWGALRLTNGVERLRAFIEQERIDLVIGDPLDSLGVNGVGSPEDTREFVELLKGCGLFRDVAFWLNHHGRKLEAGDELDEISGAWGGRPDTMLKLDKLEGNRGRLSFPKVRWSRRGSRPALILAFDPETESFAVVGEDQAAEDDRDYRAEVIAYLSEHPLRTAKQIAAPKEPKKPEDEPGIGASEITVKEILEAEPETFELVTGEDAAALGRKHNAKLYLLRQPANAADAAPQTGAFPGGAQEAAALLRSPERNAAADAAPPAAKQRREAAAATARHHEEAPYGAQG